MIYVGSAESEEYDQVLDSVFVGPIPEGKHMFVFQVIWKTWLLISGNKSIFSCRLILQMSHEFQKMTRWV